MRLELLIDGACEREVLLQLNKDTVAKFCFMLMCYQFESVKRLLKVLESVTSAMFILPVFGTDKQK